MEDIETGKSEVLKSILLLKKDIKKEFEKTNSNTIDEKIYYYNNLKCINVFQELFIIAYNTKEENLHNSFVKITKNLIESCKVHKHLEKSSWDVYMETYKNIDKIIRKAFCYET
ncbi:hypothetical protein CACET_c27330 [Clostridium aceticum]|uniref:Uncharacterized protein n=1 Tax=Clostridium aceticum TaxID=84022 RepID=A0A0D8I974_9CLOT|nr:hypothetical protein [Clostridium aceticum]AKL96178.1 hypothetical protein CACET_c27330 [Clostridium aceticum]KJF26599.1 hypothetical protein TZ02_12035 [Clostridium aceticum]